MTDRLTRPFVLGLLAAVGCGGDPSGLPPPGPVSFHPVAGQVLVGGKPAAGVKVVFVPTSAPSPPRVPAFPHATTDADGRFRLGTATAGDGAAEGGYQITMVWPPERKEGEEPSEADRLLNWYDLAHTELAFAVKAGANEVPVLKVPNRSAPPPAVEGIPGRN